eukprot:scaffold125155_cov60-Phaeocystis_antarctica.AAC.3
MPRRPPLQEKRNIYDQISAADELRQQQQDLVTRLRTELQARAALIALRRLLATHPAAAPLYRVFSVDEIERKIKVPATPAPSNAASHTPCRPQGCAPYPPPSVTLRRTPFAAIGAQAADDLAHDQGGQALHGGDQEAVVRQGGVHGLLGGGVAVHVSAVLPGPVARCSAGPKQHRRPSDSAAVSP